MRAETAPFTGFFDTTKLQVEAGGMASEPVTWHSGNNTVPFFTLVISLNNGAIESMEWDRGCFGCIGASSACSAERFCTELYCEQPNAQGQPRNCDVKVGFACGVFVLTVSLGLRRLDWHGQQRYIHDECWSKVFQL
jgi:hypothetical protein